MRSAVSVRDVRKHYDMGQDVIVDVLHGVDLEVAPGELVCLMGPSGSGKSTLLNLIGALDRPSSGTIVVDGVTLSELDDERSAKYRRERLGFVFQSFNLVPTLTACENVMMPLTFAGTSPVERMSRARTALERVGLGHRIDHKPTELSGGEQQRVAIARSLINEPALILADEPTGNLDSATGEQILEYLTEAARDGSRTFIITTHDAEVASRADRIVHIRDGLIQPD